MSSGPFIAGGIVVILADIGLLGFGMWDRSLDLAMAGLGLAIAGYLMVELGKMVSY